MEIKKDLSFLKSHIPRPNIYENIEQLSYGELLTAISNVKLNLSKITDKKIYEHQSNYYRLLVNELDKRQNSI